MGYLRHWFYLRSRPEPLRQSALLLMLAGAVGDARVLLETLRSHESESRGEWGEAIRQLRSLLESGHSLSSAFMLIDGFMPPATVAAIAVAEGGSGLTEVLLDESRRLSGRMSRGDGSDATIGAVVLWGLAVFSVMCVIGAYLGIRIVPKMKAIYDGFGAELPSVTRAAVGAWGVLEGVLPLLVLPCAGGVIYSMVLIWKSCSRQMRLGYQPILCQWPRYWTPVILRLLRTGVTTNTPITRVMESMVLMLPAGRTATRVLDLRDRILSGEDLYQALEITGLTRARERRFLESAARSGHADWGLQHVAESIDRARRRRVCRLRSLCSPVITAGFGVVVLFYCLAVFQALTGLLENLS
ncbi:MAG TPA: hypothetical protein DCR20_07915 [Planctomycetaceae bacterium]|nr:hypothetical protein [Planctomycetaceae bacterium]